MSNEEDGTNGLEGLLNESVREAGPAQAPAAPVAQQQPQMPQPVPQPAQQQPARRANEVFAPAADSPVKELSRVQYVAEELGYEIPTDAVPLPSAGIIYPLGHPLHNAQSVEYTAMTAREEDILMSSALIKRGTVISELIKSSLVNKSIDVRTLLSGDQQALMLHQNHV